MTRLANRLAMLASDSGEAENAGRAVGAMARRLGLTGGDLKQIFLSGLKDGIPKPRAPASDGDDPARALGENRTLKQRLDDAEARLRGAIHERDALRAQVAGLKASLERKRSRGQQAAFLAGLTVVTLLLIGTTAMFFGTSFRSTGSRRAAIAVDGVQSSPGGHFAQVRPKGAAMRDIPDAASPVLSTLPAGAHLAVRRLLWNGLQQWAEVDIDGRNAYVLTTDVDLP